MPAYKSFLKEREGVVQPSSINPSLLNKKITLTKSNYLITQEEYIDGIRKNDRVLLGKAITLIESKKPDHRHLADTIIESCLPFSGNSIRIGITGVPGVGKSSFIEKLGLHILDKGHRLAVLAIDPTSMLSKGSILGDKTRMETLSNQPNVFIRATPSGGALGGVAQYTREAIIVLEAAGFDVILVETVGVGQSETTVHSMVDFFLLLMLSGAGDELQGIKRGIMEMADCIAINKADGTGISMAEQAKQEYARAMHLLPPHPGNWDVPVHTCSAHENTGINTIWDSIVSYKNHTQNNSYFDKKRQSQYKHWFFETIESELKLQFYSHPLVQENLSLYEQRVDLKELSAFEAARKLFRLYTDTSNHDERIKTSNKKY